VIQIPPASSIRSKNLETCKTPDLPLSPLPTAKKVSAAVVLEEHRNGWFSQQLQIETNSPTKRKKEEATQDVVLQQTPTCAIIICDIIPATTTLDSWIQKRIGKSYKTRKKSHYRHQSQQEDEEERGEKNASHISLT
jgi:hypothetical protein